MELVNYDSRKEYSMSTKALLEEQIQSTIEEIGKLDVGSEKHEKATEALAKLLDKYNAMERLEVEIREKYDSKEAENALKEAEYALKEEQLKHEKRDAIIKNILTGLQVVACGIMIPIWGVKAAAKYEEEGVFKNVWTRAAITDILPKRKK